MDILKYKDYEGTAELDMDRRVCRGRILFIDDLVTYEAETPAQLQAEFEAAVKDYIETCAEVGKEPQKPCKGLFNVRVPPETHRAAVLRATADGCFLNEVVVRALNSYLFGAATVNHNLQLTLVAPGVEMKTIRAIASTSSTKWEAAHVH